MGRAIMVAAVVVGVCLLVALVYQPQSQAQQAQTEVGRGGKAKVVTSRVNLDIYYVPNPGTGYQAENATTTTTAGEPVNCRSFQDAVDQYLPIVFTVPKDWDSTIPLTFFILWNDNNPGTADVKWDIRYNRVSTGENRGSLPFPTLTKIATYPADSAFVRTEFTIPAGGTAGPLVPGEAMVINLYRRGAALEDTSTSSAISVYAAGIDYTVQ